MQNRSHAEVEADEHFEPLPSYGELISARKELADKATAGYQSRPLKKLSRGERIAATFIVAIALLGIALICDGLLHS
ncbi:hypothetical protein [Oryzifoliimicrobium ureilyticus]|uniref:hypothetical protein n=1 Tax=Oryzifoliimicrobium ureilyticus TaxID=3113724 RepID=UPI00307674F1